MNDTSTTVSWAPEPQERGTIGLVWSCFATIFICTWSAIHPNLPEIDESFFSVLERRITYLVAGLIAPEYIAWGAFGELQQAWKLKAQIAEKRSNVNQWSLKQCFFLHMGGYMILQDEVSTYIEPSVLADSFMSGEISWPETRESNIDDRDGTNGFLKIIVLLQIIWFMAQAIGRGITGLPMSTLELFTLGNVLCAFCTYIAWWKKPYDVRVRIPIVTPAGLQHLPSPAHTIKRVSIGGHDSKFEWRTTVPISLVCLGFGALHLVGWGFHFPSRIERILWRICSVGITGTSLLAVWAGVIQMKFYPFTVSFLSLYVLFRLYLFVEMFAGLRAVPADLYKTVQWAQYFPSFG